MLCCVFCALCGVCVCVCVFCVCVILVCDGGDGDSFFSFLIALSGWYANTIIPCTGILHYEIPRIECGCCHV